MTLKIFLLALNLFLFSQDHSTGVKTIKAVPGGEYLLPETGENVKILVIGSGGDNLPFIIRSRGKQSKLTGDSFIKISNSSKNIVLREIIFENNLISYRESTALLEIGNSKMSKASNIFVENIHFYFDKKFMDGDKATQFHWINIFGDNVTIKDCAFQGKKNRLPIIHVNSNFKGNKIESNLFKDVPSRAEDALEAIRIGLNDGASDVKIFNNRFIRYYGDSETISVKSDNPEVYNNTFTDCRSGIVLRLANNCKIYGNTFTNTETPIRISGSNHKIYKNRFGKNKYEKSIVFMTGGTSYPIVKNIEFYDNHFATNSIFLSVLQFPRHNAPPENISFKNNYLHNKKMKDKQIKKVVLSRKQLINVRNNGISEYKFEY